jgi:hypothetical protein
MVIRILSTVAGFLLFWFFILMFGLMAADALDNPPKVETLPFDVEMRKDIEQQGYTKLWIYDNGESRYGLTNSDILALNREGEFNCKEIRPNKKELKANKIKVFRCT